MLNLASGCARNGIDCRVYSWTGEDTWLDAFKRRNIPVEAIGGPNRIRGVADLLGLAQAWFRLVGRLQRDRIDIVHTHDFLPSLVGRTASLVAGVPVRVATLHNLYDWWPRWAHRMNRLLARRTDAITCVSDSVRTFMAQRERIPPERMSTILNGVDETRFRPDPAARTAVRVELGLSDDEILIGSVGSITTRKAHWLLIEAVAPLIREGARIQVRIWGMNTSNPQHAESDLLERIRRHGLEGRVQVLPPRPDIERVYNAMDIHCMTSVTEGLSLASVEAMMCGVLPVYSDIGPFREVVTDGSTGRLFRNGESADLERVLRDVLADPSRSVRRDAIRSDAVERFSLSRSVGQYVELYRKLVGVHADS